MLEALREIYRFGNHPSFEHSTEDANTRDRRAKRTTAIFLLVAVPAAFYMREYKLEEIPHNSLIGKSELAAVYGSVFGGVCAVIDGNHQYHTLALIKGIIATALMSPMITQLRLYLTDPFRSFLWP